MPLFYVARDEDAERNAQQEGKQLPMMVTSTWPLLMEWPRLASGRSVATSG